MSTVKVYCDMDGVLANFTKAFNEFVGNVVKGWRTIDHRDWKRLQKTWPTFWMDLEPMPYAGDLWRVIAPHNPSILTAVPEPWPAAGVGKAVWARRHLPKFGYHPSQKLHAVLRHEKQQYARHEGRPSVLIDDMDKNIIEWRAAGGVGIHYIPSRASVVEVDRTLRRMSEE